MGYNGYTEKKKLSNRKYLQKFKRVTLCFTPQEKEIIEYRAQKEGQTITKYIRSRLGFSETPLAEPQMVDLLRIRLSEEKLKEICANSNCTYKRHELVYSSPIYDRVHGTRTAPDICAVIYGEYENGSESIIPLSGEELDDVIESVTDDYQLDTKENWRRQQDTT